MVVVFGGKLIGETATTMAVSLAIQIFENMSED